MKKFANLHSFVSSLILCLGMMAGTSVVFAQDDDGDVRTAGNVRAVVSRIADELGSHEVNVTSFGGTVLLTGQVASDEDKQRISSAIAFANTGAYRVVNELAVGAAAARDVAADSALRDEILAKVAADFPDLAGEVGVVVESRTVFLLGRLGREQAMEVATMVSLIQGVQAIRMVFDFVG